MGHTLRIVSANLLAGGADGERFAARAAELGAHAVAVQELHPEQAEALAARFPHGLLAPREDHHGGGLALAREARVEPLPTGRRDAYRATLEPGAWPELVRPLEIVGLHAHAPHAELGLGLLRRPGQMRRLRAHLASHAPGGRVVVGDFNATPLWPLYRGMASAMEDAARTVARREGRRPQRTWGPLTLGLPLLRIDHAFVTGLVPEALHVVPIEGSDHRALVLDVAVGDGTPDGHPR